MDGLPSPWVGGEPGIPAPRAFACVLSAAVVKVVLMLRATMRINPALSGEAGIKMSLDESVVSP